MTADSAVALPPHLVEMPIIDAHHHLWTVDGQRYPRFAHAPDPNFFLGDDTALRHDFLPADYRAAASGHNVVATVHCEAEWRRDDQLGETRWLTAIADAHGLPDALVGHAWLDDADVDEVLAGHAECSRMRGIRSKPALPGGRGTAGEGRGAMTDPAWRAGYARLAAYGFSYDLRVPHPQLAEAADVIGRHDDIPVVLNHTGFPWDRSEAGLAAWRRDVSKVAALPHVCVKLSELGLRDAPWDFQDNRRVVLEAIEIFGVERCMFASNFPVAGLKVSFNALFDAYKRMVADFSADEQRALFHDNAARFYRIPLATGESS